MQRTWMRALIFVAVSAVSVLATSEAEAQGPVRRLFRRMFGRDNVVSANTYTYLDANGNRMAVRNGNIEGRFDASGRWIGPLDRTARGGTRVETRFDGQVSPATRPATRIEADANVRTPGGANVRGGADVNRNDGTIRGNADANLRGNVTPPVVPATPAAPDATLPPVAPIP